jgi:hypothetical protein
MSFARELFRLIVLGAINHQVTHIVVAGSIFAETRDLCERCHPKLGQLVRCHLCFGTWTGLLLAVVFRPRFIDLDERRGPFRRPSRSRQLAGLLADAFAIALAGRFYTEILAILQGQAAIKREQQELLEERVEREKQQTAQTLGEPLANPGS